MRSSSFKLTMFGLLYASGYLRERSIGITAYIPRGTHSEMYFAVGIESGSHPILRALGSSVEDSAFGKNMFLGNSR